MDDSLVVEDFCGRSRIPPYNLAFKISFIKNFFRMVYNRKVSVGPALSIGPFQKVQGEVIYFPYVVRKKGKLP